MLHCGRKMGAFAGVLQCCCSALQCFAVLLQQYFSYDLSWSWDGCCCRCVAVLLQCAAVFCSVVAAIFFI